MKSTTAKTVHAILLSVVLSMGTAAAASGGDDPKAGKEIYEKQCAPCHGVKGEGSPIMPGMPNLADSKVMAQKTDDALLTTIANGKEGTPMREWKSVLNEQDRKNVLSFIRTFSGTKSP